MLERALSLFDLTLKDPYHTTSSDWVFTYNETGAGYKVTFEKAFVQTHEETGKKRVKFRYELGPKFYTETDWKLATAFTDRQGTYSTILMRGKYKPTFPKEEYLEEL